MPFDTSFERSLVRDQDGALLLSVRGFGIEGVPREDVAKIDPSLKNCFRVFRSTDGRHWVEILKVEGVRPWSPVVMGKTAKGRVFPAANERAEPWPEVRGNTLPDARMRENLAPGRSTRSVRCWPSEPHCRCGRTSGRAPSRLTWYLDHPISAVVRLADGIERTLLSFRVCDSGRRSCQMRRDGGDGDLGGGSPLTMLRVVTCEACGHALYCSPLETAVFGSTLARDTTWGGEP